MSVINFDISQDWRTPILVMENTLGISQKLLYVEKFVITLYDALHKKCISIFSVRL